MESNATDENNFPKEHQDPMEGTDLTGEYGRSEKEVSSPKMEIEETQPMSPNAVEENEVGLTDAAQSENTHPIHLTGDTTPSAENSTPLGRRRSWFFLAFLGILTLLLIASFSAYGGYRSAIGERNNFKETQIAEDAEAQFLLGMEDMQSGRYELARQRFEYVIQLDPNFPGIEDRLAEVLLELRTTATPTAAPTPTLTPTPDLRGRDEIYDQARQMLMSGDWGNTIETLLTLRKRYPEFNTVKVDGMLYVALRNQGVDKISAESDLEGGMYDLTLAEKFGPLDAEARNWRSWAELYRLGAGFWDIDWGQAVYYFSQLASAAPNLRDGSGLTARDRYHLALLGYGDWLIQRGEWCLASEQYEIAREVNPDPDVEPTAEYVSEQCDLGVDQPPEELPEGGTPQPQPTAETPSPTSQPGPTPYP